MTLNYSLNFSVVLQFFKINSCSLNKKKLPPQKNTALGQTKKIGTHTNLEMKERMMQAKRFLNPY